MEIVDTMKELRDFLNSDEVARIMETYATEAVFLALYSHIYKALKPNLEKTDFQS